MEEICDLNADLSLTTYYDIWLIPVDELSRWQLVVLTKHIEIVPLYILIRFSSHLVNG